DRFAREQLAGDELPDGGTDGLVATGYYRLGIWDDEPSDRDQAPYDGFDAPAAATGQVFLGLTIDCARCHDHKLDPIPQKDYYRFVAFFHDVTPMDRANLKRVSSDKARREYEREQKERRQREGKLYSELYRLEQKLVAELAAK